MALPVTQLSANTATNLLEREVTQAFIKLANLDSSGNATSPERSSGNVLRERAAALTALSNVSALGASLKRNLFSNKIVQTVANNTGELTLLDATGFGNLSIPAAHLVQGAQFEITLSGLLSTFSSGTLTFKTKCGVAGATVLATTGAITPQASQTNVPWYAEFLFQVLTAGASGFLVGSGTFCIEAPTRSCVALATAITGTAQDLTVAQQLLDVTAQWSVANAANSISVFNAAISRLR